MSYNKSLINKDLYLYYIFLVAGIIYIYVTSKAESFLILNSLHNPFLDSVMPYITWMGDGLFAAIVALVFLLYRVRYGIFLGLSFITSGLLAQTMKKVIFSGELRPMAYFREIGTEIHTIPEVKQLMLYSFPSGHSTTAFACFVGISFLVKQWYWKMILLLVAIIVGYSRVYIAVHFPVDVIAGSLIGVLSSYLFYIWVSQWKKPWLDVSLGAKILNSVKK
ncbi:MAG: phosphatase PAP2 family protein [Bacteroidota bacterium]